MSDVLTTGEAAARLRIHESTVRRGINRGQLPGYRVGDKYVIPSIAFDRFLNGEWQPRSATPPPTTGPVLVTRKAS